MGHLVGGNTEAARSCRDLLNELEPGSTVVEQLNRLLEPKNSAALAMFGLLRNLLGRGKSKAPRSRTPRRKLRPQEISADQGELFSLDEHTA